MDLNFNNPAEDAYEALKWVIRELERNLKDGESICVSGMGPNCSEFFLQKTFRRGPLIGLIGDADDERFEELVFAANQISIRLFTAKRSGHRKPIGFDTE